MPGLIVQQPEPPSQAGQRHVDEGIVLGLQPPERAPVHSLGFDSVAVENAWFPLQPPAQRVRAPA